MGNVNPDLEIEVNVQTLNAHGRYVDQIWIPELEKKIRVVITKAPELSQEGGVNLGATPNI